eukprot:CAMPEP_0117546264 /NCGR_PEP_ID=MMETSP0784-20121206/46518_1 /TAXON_ID=39447 /ORGANISM="" /LENGTH=564 /DNA_ID=CAMNT_0005343131 /DNA_START=19 /DNA_END=1713 /DNA_ORIENTATION=+
MASLASFMSVRGKHLACGASRTGGQCFRARLALALAARCGYVTGALRIPTGRAATGPALKALLLPRDVVPVLADRITSCGGALPVRELARLYREHVGLKEVVEAAGGLKRLVDEHASHLVWEADFVRAPPRLQGERSIQPEPRDLTPDEVAFAIAVYVKVEGGSVPRSVLDDLVGTREGFGDVVDAAGGLKELVRRYATQVVWTQHSVKLASVFLASLMQTRGGQLSSGDFKGLCEEYARLPDAVRFVEPKATEAERAQATSRFAAWRAGRLGVGADPESSRATSMDWWYAEVCLACLAHCPLQQYSAHAATKKHLQAYSELRGLRLRPGVHRPDPHAADGVALSEDGDFYSVGRFATSRVLVLGESDFSFSLRVAQLQRETTGETQLVATSYLAAYNASEPEVCLSRGVPIWYRKKHLSDNDGALHENLRSLGEMGAQILHEVDAADIDGTLLRRGTPGGFDVISFPFPQASPCSDPRNASLIRDFFRSVESSDVLADSGVVQVVLLSTQYAAWDVTYLAFEAGFKVDTRVAFPEYFYQSRLLIGKGWSPRNAHLYVFGRRER